MCLPPQTVELSWAQKYPNVFVREAIDPAAATPPTLPEHWRKLIFNEDPGTLAIFAVDRNRAADLLRALTEGHDPSR